VEPESCETQYQEDIVRRTAVRRFDIAVGRCRVCRRRVQGRHPWQTSNAVGGGQRATGPEALALAAILNKQLGLSLDTRGKSGCMDSGCKPVGADCVGR